MKVSRVLLWFGVLAMGARFSHAQGDCTDVIAQSKTITDIVQSSSAIEKYANDFCSDYASHKGNSTSVEGAASYGIFSAALGVSHASVESLALKYCNRTDSSKANADAYHNYVETIAPGAYSSYEHCLELLRDDHISIALNRNGVLPQEMFISVSYKTANQSARQTLSFWASDGVDCVWHSSGKRADVQLLQNGEDALQCKRKNTNQRSTISIIVPTRAGSTVTFSWDSYTRTIPDNYLGMLSRQVNDLSASLRGSVMSFNLEKCPPGWREYIPAYGRFVRGLDRSGQRIDPEGKRKAGDLQEDEFKEHDHAQLKVVFDAGGPKSGSVKGGNELGYDYDREGVRAPPTGKAGKEETRPKNVALLYCIHE